jgi:hypothetical protein
MRGDEKSKEVCLKPDSANSLVKDKWTVDFKNWD